MVYGDSVDTTSVGLKGIIPTVAKVQHALASVGYKVSHQ